jgi:hypothetical protein
VIAATVGGAVGTTAAQAYDTDHTYQLMSPLNCDIKASPLCAPDQFGLGGMWGWIKPDSDGTAAATIIFCDHSRGVTGAFHQNLEGASWSIVRASGLDGNSPPGRIPPGITSSWIPIRLWRASLSRPPRIITR